MDDIEKELISIFNLKPYEARIYRAVLSYGTASPSDVSRKLKIPRTALYAPLKILIARGFIAPLKMGKRIRYRAISGEDLQKMLAHKATALESLIPDLTHSLSLSKHEFSVTMYHGSEGVLLASDIFLEETKGKLWKIVENPLHTLDVVGVPLMEHYLKERVARDISCRVIIPASVTKSGWMQEKMSMNKKELREVIVVSENIYPIDASIVVNEHLVLVIVAKDDIFALLIRSDALCRTIGSIHDMVWDRFQKI